MSYCEPWNCGFASSTRAVEKKLGQLIDALDCLNSQIVQGEIVEDIREFRLKLIKGLEGDGYTCSYNGGYKMKVRKNRKKK